MWALAYLYSQQYTVISALRWHWMVSVYFSHITFKYFYHGKWGPMNFGCIALPFTQYNGSPSVSVSSVRSMLPQTRVVKTMGCIFCIRGISDLPSDSMFWIRNAVTIGWVTVNDILWSRWFSTCSNSSLLVNDFTTIWWQLIPMEYGIKHILADRTNASFSLQTMNWIYLTSCQHKLEEISQWCRDIIVWFTDISKIGKPYKTYFLGQNNC